MQGEDNCGGDGNAMIKKSMLECSERKKTCERKMPARLHLDGRRFSLEEARRLGTLRRLHCQLSLGPLARTCHLCACLQFSYGNSESNLSRPSIKHDLFSASLTSGTNTTKIQLPTKSSRSPLSRPDHVFESCEASAFRLHQARPWHDTHHCPRFVQQ
jgi:hypothetical protein